MVACSSSGTKARNAPTLVQLTTDPNPPVAPRIHFTATGSNLDSNTLRVFFKGPGCPDSCEVPKAAVDELTQNRVSGLADLGIGQYEFFVKNGESAPSNSLSLALVSTPPIQK